MPPTQLLITDPEKVMSVCRHHPEDQPVGICPACLMDNIVKLEQKLAEAGIIAEEHRNACGDIVCIGDVQWIDGDDGPMGLVVKEILLLHGGQVGMRGHECGLGVKSWTSTTWWYKLCDCYGTKEALETLA